MCGEGPSFPVHADPIAERSVVGRGVLIDIAPAQVMGGAGAPVNPIVIN